MTVHRLMGIETEYGVIVQGQPHFNPMLASAHIVNAFVRSQPQVGGHHVRWEYGQENPLRDARGFDMSRSDADPSQLTDQDLGSANTVLTNGARLYVDHAHPEYSSPEVLSPKEAVLYDKAGEIVMLQAIQECESDPQTPTIRLYKNNTDGKGAAYGTHENYLMKRSTPFNEIAASLIPFFVARTLFTGSGRVGIGREGEMAGFQIGSRPDYFEAEVGLETTFKRPIINTRDEPHADANEYRRLHVIIGDANLSQVATYMKMGFTSLVLNAIERGVDFSDLALFEPVAQLHAVSHDTDMRHLVPLKDGRKITALDLLEIYVERAEEACQWDRLDRDTNEDEVAETEDIIYRVKSVIDRLRADKFLCVKELDWVAKLRLLEGYKQRDKLNWSDPQLSLVDLQYSDIDPRRGIALRLESKGALETIISSEDASRAGFEPPTDTRAWFRGQCISNFPNEVAAASWDAVVFDTQRRDSLQRVSTVDPFRGTKELVSGLFDKYPSADDFLDALEQQRD